MQVETFIQPGIAGVPCGIRTHGLLLRRQTLYPAELRGRVRGGLMAGGAPRDHHQYGDEADDEGDKDVRAVMIRVLFRIVPRHALSFLTRADA